ncbi:MAG: hypothetical protein ACYCDN_07435 [Schaalia turicensis]|uniref:hypothetical protein n=1 Tax=Actinomycetaceae TaxID=2049 RepID=UPI000B2D0A7D|nr:MULTISPECIES: hypothetical protein [Actinomycetaceae]MDK7781519.1 hypothetical protein [Actinomycetaceae bacterium UMB8041B]MDK8300230.1 hypothetical protein [Actinomycetaceae bacterium UMB1218B]MDK8609252.1 hypothetical protein [Actinomycetaceae bacterium UMB8041A]MDK8753654.1 hypothetical protein [Actinomycetaceae bacterium UMB8039A]MDK6831114.1 hypothetical protein [Pauljensenia sp. UMB8040A]
MTSQNHLARRTPFGGMPVGTGFVGAGDTLATLINAGYSYQQVQNRVNQILG